MTTAKQMPIASVRRTRLCTNGREQRQKQSAGRASRRRTSDWCLDDVCPTLTGARTSQFGCAKIIDRLAEWSLLLFGRQISVPVTSGHNNGRRNTAGQWTFGSNVCAASVTNNRIGGTRRSYRNDDNGRAPGRPLIKYEKSNDNNNA